MKITGGTKEAEYLRTIELFERIFHKQGTYYALAFLCDTQTENKDLKEMIKLIQPLKNVAAI